MDQSWVYMCPPSWNPSHLPPHPILQGHPSALALSAQSHASKLDWWSMSHMVIYIYFNAIFLNHPTLAFSQSPKVCSLHLCLFHCLTYRVIVPIFLNFIYMHLCTVLVFFFLTYFILYNRLQFYAPHWNWFKFILLNNWVIFHCVCVPQLSYPFVC